MFTPWDQLSRKEQLASTHYDFYKDVHGIRPRWMNYDAMTEEQLEAELDQLGKEAEVVWAEEKAQEERSIAEFEVRVQTLIDAGANDRATAVRWIDDAYDTNGDMDFLCFHLGLPYGYLS